MGGEGELIRDVEAAQMELEKSIVAVAEAKRKSEIARIRLALANGMLSVMLKENCVLIYGIMQVWNGATLPGVLADGMYQHNVEFLREWLFFEIYMFSSETTRIWLVDPPATVKFSTCQTEYFATHDDGICVGSYEFWFVDR